jgi:mycothiol synthase
VNVRRPALADVEAVVELVAAYDSSLGAPPDASVDDLREEWADIDLERDAWLFELDGRLAGYGCVFGQPEKLSTDGYVHPALRGRGVGSAILRLSEERARELGAAQIRNATLHADTGGRALFEARGYEFQRAFLRMSVDLDGEPPAPSVPDGLRLERFDPADARAVHAALEEAFAEHWGNVPETFDSWQARRLEKADPSLWLVVKDGDEIAAASANHWKRFGAGWVGALGVRPQWRRRGLAEALLRASFREFHRRGETRVALGVDSENPTGAVRLYERVGMRTVWRADVYGKDLA